MVKIELLVISIKLGGVNMDTIKTRECYNDLLAKKLIEEFEKRNIEGFYYKTKEEALKKVLKIIPKDNLVSCGGSLTLHEIGLKTALKNGGYNFLDPAEPQGGKEKENVARQALLADYFLMSSNAIAATGELVNIDGIGNRVSALIFGPKNVIIVAGLNKVVPNLDTAILRVKDYAAKMVVSVYKQDYSSFEELSKAAENGCSQLVITSKSMFKGRIKVILVGENLGI
ncbi:lactate utilization protein [Clostridium kluyveri]|uniref:lactate utilization protein n=1 Tax=Clostridium kluyveri TaxID=1534 RepID=UPI001FA84A03|nr:lactate utilization protein [Clostridium kluyveri]